MKNNKFLFLITLSYFALGFVNIHLALLALICMSIPMILLFKNTKKTWCQGYCPRSNLYTTCGKLTSKHSKKTPQFFIKGKMKWIMLGYFGFSLVFIAVTTIIVARGAAPMDMVRFLMLIPIGSMPQLITISTPYWLLHLSYRFYSMMLTTTTLGLILALVYKPRTWCTICPISTVSDVYIKSKKKA